MKRAQKYQLTHRYNKILPEFGCLSFPTTMKIQHSPRETRADLAGHLKPYKTELSTGSNNNDLPAIIVLYYRYK